MTGFKHNQVVRFILSGGTATAIHYLTMFVLIYFDTPAAVATAVGALVGAVLNYVFQYYYTFRSIRRHLHSLLSYIFASGLSWTSNLVLFLLFHDAIGMHIVIAQLITTAMVTVQNYFVYKKAVFHSSITG